MKIKTVVFYLTGLFIFLGASCQQSATNKDVKLESSIDSISYSIGLQMGDNFINNLSSVPAGEDLDLNIVVQGFSVAINKEEPLFSIAESTTLVRDFMNNRMKEVAQANLEEGNAFLEQNKAREGVITTESGLQYEILKEGNGPLPKATDKVKVNYEGTFIDGEVFDSSVKRGSPMTFPVNGVIKGWSEALQLMPVGSKWKVYIPSNLAYGERGSGHIKPNSTIIFEVELLEIVESN